jgi:hypothetical protein
MNANYIDHANRRSIGTVFRAIIAKSLLVAIVALGPPTRAPAQEVQSSPSEGPRVVAESSVVVFPGGASPGDTCLLLDAGTLTVELRRVADMGGGPYPVTFSLRTFVVAEAPIPGVAISSMPVTLAVPVSADVYCYSFEHSETWTNRPESAPKGQVITLRLTHTP